MAKCPGCGSELPAVARFCPLCGRTVTAATGPASAHGLSDAPGPSGGDAGRRKVALAVAAGTALIAVAAFLFARASGILAAPRPGMGSGGGILSAPAPASTPAPLLTAPAPTTPQAPVLQAPQTAQNPMPDDVVGYLRWLKKFEEGRRNLEYRGMSELTVFTQQATTGALQGLLNADPTGEPAPTKPENNPVVGIGKVIQDWNIAAQNFQRVPPPNPCAPLAASYNQALTAGVAQMSAIQGMLTGALDSLQGSNGQATSVSKDTLTELYRQKGTRQGSVNVDTAYSQANSALDSLRAQYTSMPEDIRTFDIKSGGGGLNLPFMGL